MLAYKIDRAMLPEGLRDSVSEFTNTSRADAFIADCVANPHTVWERRKFGFFLYFFADYDAHALLHYYPTHLLSKEDWGELVPERLRGGALLDIGAGEGFITENARHLFGKISATETSPIMTKRLRSRGFDAHTIDVAARTDIFPERSFDVISILNVLDRASHPKKLVQNALHFLKDDGILIISDPLPLQPYVRGRIMLPAAEKIKSTRSTLWEECAADFWKTVFEPLGVTPVRIARLPYLFKEDIPEKYCALDDCLFVCKKNL